MATKKRAERRKEARVMSPETKRILAQRPDAAHIRNRMVLKPMRKPGRFQILFDGVYVGYVRVRDGVAAMKAAHRARSFDTLNLEHDKPKIERTAIVLTAMQSAQRCAA